MAGSGFYKESAISIAALITSISASEAAQTQADPESFEQQRLVAHFLDRTMAELAIFPTRYASL